MCTLGIKENDKKGHAIEFGVQLIPKLLRKDNLAMAVKFDQVH